MTFQQKFLIVVMISTATALALAVTLKSGRGTQRPVRLEVFGWLAAVGAALLLVGVVSDTLLRHMIQITPLVFAFIIGMRRSAFTAAAALPIFTFWLFAMGGIWLTLLGIAPVFTGSYGPAEIALTVVVGLASVSGLVAIVRQGTGLSLAPRLGTVLTFAILQPAALLLSF